MIVYLIDIESGEVKQTYTNVISFSHNYVEFDNNGRCKIYCNPEIEFFSKCEE